MVFLQVDMAHSESQEDTSAPGAVRPALRFWACPVQGVLWLVDVFAAALL